jgi:hypothetical protein
MRCLPGPFPALYQMPEEWDRVFDPRFISKEEETEVRHIHPLYKDVWLTRLKQSGNAA